MLSVVNRYEYQVASLQQQNAPDVFVGIDPGLGCFLDGHGFI